MIAVYLSYIKCGRAQPILPGGGGPTNTPLASWSFHNSTNWISDEGYSPISFTNLAFSRLGNGDSLVVDTNLPAWLQFPVIEPGDAATNLIFGSGSVTFWFAPAWSSTNQGGLGPGEPGRLFEAGAYTTNSSYGWFSLYVDSGGNNLYFSTQTNDLSGNAWTWLSAPISWKTNYFHYITLTYSPSNTSLYLDGAWTTNGPALTVYPGANVNEFCIGGSSNGVFQAQGLFNAVQTYSYPLGSNDVRAIFNWDYGYYLISPWNTAMWTITSAPSSPSYGSTYNAVTGQGDLQWVGTAGSCSDGTNADDIWITNVTATVAGSGTNMTMNVAFTIEGGASGTPYDVFANSVLSFGTSGVPWAWMGQGYQCNTYTLTNLPPTACFLILGTPQDTSGAGLTDAYELLVAKVNPDGSQYDNYGVPYAWYAQNGLSAQSATQDPDQDGLLNYQEYFYGTKPQVSEGFGIWVATPDGGSGIP